MKTAQRPAIFWQRIKGYLGVALVLASAGIGLHVQATEQKGAPLDCVTLGVPKPSLAYTYEHTQTTGKGSRYTDRWESVTSTSSRVRVTRQGGTQINVLDYRIVNDVSVLARARQLNASGGVIDTTSFGPGLIGDPAFRACAGRSWTIPSVTVSYRSGQNQASAIAPPGTLRIVAVHEKLAVPAGQFDTVRYIRKTQSSDEYWKSIEHGVVVKHIGTLGGAVAVTEVLVSIK